MPSSTNSRTPHTTTGNVNHETTPDNRALEAGIPVSSSSTLDIEHALVDDDPRSWGSTRKYLTLALVAIACLIATMAVNIYNPAITDIKAQLGATDQEISLTISLFIIIQGSTPLLWSAVSEFKGRKFVYIISLLLFTAGCAVAASASRMEVLISMRILQALGTSVASAIGAGTLADIYEPHERGTKIGLYFSVPLIGPAVGPIFGGILTDAFNWRATFWFLVILGGFMWACFLLLFKDTFRRERSLTYQLAMKRARTAAEKRKAGTQIPASRSRHTAHNAQRELSEKAEAPNTRADEVRSLTGIKTIEASSASHVDDVKLTLADVNPLHPILSILRRKNNITILIPSALIFAFSYSISYTCVRTFAAAPYNYSAMHIGLVLLSFGIGNMIGSILGGRYSDHLRAKYKADPNREATAETRLYSAFAVMWILPPSTILYAWFAHEHLHVAGVCVSLFLAGFSSIWIYAATLAYIVDANVGRSSAAVATNSCFRGTSAFIAAEIAVPIQDAIGDAGLYMIWAGLLVVMELLILLTAKRGKAWRERAEEREAKA
ncbi:vacuolar DHA amino acid exporter [Auricularia subglabra TFB-10046 SS5]|nr:vacuolar DHA amino acid exporter [Auricularia subglabra TFB-10046 SS5]